MSDTPPPPDVVNALDRMLDCHVQSQAFLPMWVVYRPTTREYPGLYVVRLHLSLPQTRSTEFVLTDTTLEGLHRRMPPWLVGIGRYETDVPEILEVWL